MVKRGKGDVEKNKERNWVESGNAPVNTGIYQQGRTAIMNTLSVSFYHHFHNSTMALLNMDDDRL